MGYRPEPEDKGAGKIRSVKAFSSALLAAPLIGIFLLLTGLGSGAYIRVALGVLFLAASPFIARWVWRGGLWS